MGKLGIEPLTAADSDVRAEHSFHPQPSGGGRAMAPICPPPTSVAVAAAVLAVVLVHCAAIDKSWCSIWYAEQPLELTAALAGHPRPLPLEKIEQITPNIGDANRLYLHNAAACWRRAGDGGHRTRVAQARSFPSLFCLW